MAKKHNLGRAVVEQHAPAAVDHDSPQAARWRALDFFGTPPFASRAGAQLVKEIDPGAKTAWEPACGDGIMARCLAEFFTEVWASDIEPQGFGDKVDFFDVGETRFDWIITNPPFGRAREFVERGLTVAQRGVAVLCRLAFLESTHRFKLHNELLTDLCPFSERVPMKLGPWNPKCSTATAYAWFIYDKATLRRTVTARTRCRIIPPGTRDRFSYPDDVRRFVQGASGTPLFDGPKNA